MTLHIVEERFMHQAITEALKARSTGDHPVGAVIVRGEVPLAAACNRTHVDQDPTQHAEMVAIRATARRLGTKKLTGCVLYVTHEPCPMCAAAAIFSRLQGVVCGTTMDDVRKYPQKDQQWRWRIIDVPAATLLAGGDHEVFFVHGCLRNECLELFHEVPPR